MSLCDVPEGIGLTGTWETSGEMLFASVEGAAIFNVSTAGGTPAVLVKPDPEQDEARVHWPTFLPDGKRFLYLTRLRGGDGYITLGERGRSPRRILPAVSNVQWVDPQYLVFAREGALVAQRFDLKRGAMWAGQCMVTVYSSRKKLLGEMAPYIDKLVSAPGLIGKVGSVGLGIKASYFLSNVCCSIGLTPASTDLMDLRGVETESPLTGRESFPRVREAEA